MASQFVKIPQATFEDLQMDAGVLLNKFNPATPDIKDEDIITATTGGVQITCVPTYSDLGEDVDNCPNNTKELKHLDGWEVGLSTTALNANKETIKLGLGAADIDDQTGKITPRVDLEQSDFTDLWWAGRKAGGGFVACKIINALSTAGFTLQTTKNGKGQVSLEFRGHVSIEAQDVVPMEFYSTDA